jgi:O-antigen/teichoic acid export membrane protein
MRAMHQITHPITTKLMAENQHEALQALYQKTSITLQTIGGLIMVCILTNINAIYQLLPTDYEGGFWVVFVIAISKYFDLMLGNNNSIVFNSIYYKTVLFLGVCLVGITVVLNLLLIPSFGIEGAAIATLISIAFYSMAKLFFVVKKLHLFPFTKKTIGSLLICAATFFSIYFIEFTCPLVFLIILKSLFAAIMYVGLHFYFQISMDINQMIIKLTKIFLNKKAL